MILLARLCVILTLIAGSAVLAPMRGQMAGSSQIEVCSAAGVSLLTLDARGNPVAAADSCPDCLACVATGPLPDAGGVDLARTTFASALAPGPMQMATGLHAVQPAARDPPRSV